jgi:hypothetical protein
MGRELSLEQKAKLDEMAAAAIPFKEELRKIGQDNPEAVMAVGKLVEDYYMKCGYTNICKAIREYGGAL